MNSCGLPGVTLLPMMSEMRAHYILLRGDFLGIYRDAMLHSRLNFGWKYSTNTEPIVRSILCISLAAPVSKLPSSSRKKTRMSQPSSQWAELVSQLYVIFLTGSGTSTHFAS